MDVALQMLKDDILWSFITISVPQNVSLKFVFAEKTYHIILVCLYTPLFRFRRLNGTKKVFRKRKEERVSLSLNVAVFLHVGDTRS